MKNFFRKKKRKETNAFQLIVNCKSEQAKHDLFDELTGNEKIVSMQLMNGGTIIYVGSGVGVSPCYNNTTGQQNNFVGKVAAKSNEPSIHLERFDWSKPVLL